MKRKSLIAISLASMVLFSGCGGGSSESTTPAVGTTTVTAVDGYIKNATLTDNGGEVGVYTSNGQYTFSGSIAYPLTLTGGTLEDTNASFDINMTAQSGLVISPITTFLENNASLQTKLAIALGVSDSIDSFAIDYVDTNNSDVAKLSQLLYMVQKDTTLKNAFKINVAGANPASLNDMFTLAEADVNATIGVGYQEAYRTFLTNVKTLSGDVSDYETQLSTVKDSLDVDISITHNGTTYLPVTSPETGKVWLDRNLGASQVCTALDDTACYGDYYQWGRNFDGHQVSTSATTATQALDINNAGSSFVTSAFSPWDWTIADATGALRASDWSAIDGSSVCPVGYRVPSMTEITAETTAVTNQVGAFNTFLKLPSAGNRNDSGSMVNQGSLGYVWSSSVSGSNSNFLGFSSSYAITYNNIRALGFSVRCLKN